MASIYAYLNGLSGLALIILGIFMAVVYFRRYFQLKKRLLPFAGFVGITVGLLYLGSVVSFFSLVFTETTLDVILHGYLAYTIVPFTILNAIYLGFEIFGPEHTKKMLLIYGITGIVFYIAWFGFPTEMIGGTIVAGELPDISLKSVALVLVIFYILTALVVLGGGFFKLRKRIEGVEKEKVTRLAWAFVLFAIAGILDTAVPFQITVIARVVMGISLWMLYKGFSP